MFWKPGSKFPGSAVDAESDRQAEKEGEAAITAVYNPYERYSIDQQRTQLPIYKLRNQILYCLEKHRVLILIGETGSGKTTRTFAHMAFFSS